MMIKSLLNLTLMSATCLALAVPTSLLQRAGASSLPIAPALMTATYTLAEEAFAAIGPVTADDDVEEQFAPLAEKLDIIFQTMQPGRDMDHRDRNLIRRLHQQVHDFNREHPDYLRSLVAEVELLNLLARPERRTKELLEVLEQKSPVLERIATLHPDKPAIRILWARNERLKHHYDDAARIIERYGFDFVEWPEALVELVWCYFALHRFDEALWLIDSLDTTRMPGRHQSAVMTLRDHAFNYLDQWRYEIELREEEEEAGEGGLNTDELLPHVEMYTSRGRIVMELLENDAPNTVANFITLVSDGFFDQTAFHRVYTNHSARGGDPYSRPGSETEPGTGGPDYTLPVEFPHGRARSAFAGSVAMEREQDGSLAGSRFMLFIEPKPQHPLVFGRVIEGLDVLWSMTESDRIESTRVLRKRDHDYTFNRHGEDAEEGDTGESETPQPEEPGDGADPGEPGDGDPPDGGPEQG